LLEIWQYKLEKIMDDSSYVGRQWNRQSGGLSQEELRSRRLRDEMNIAKTGGAVGSAPVTTNAVGDPAIPQDPNFSARVSDFLSANVCTIAPPTPPTDLGPGGVAPIYTLFERVEDYGARLDGIDATGSPTGKPDFADHHYPEAPLFNAATLAVSFDPDQPPPDVTPAGATEIVDFLNRYIADGRTEMTPEEADDLLRHAGDMIGDVADVGGLNRDQADEAMNLLGSARDAFHAPGSTMTTADIMELVAEVLSKTAQNANEMRLAEGRSSLSGIQENLELSKKAAEQKEKGAEAQREATVTQAIAQIVGGAIEFIGGAVQFTAGLFSSAEKFTHVLQGLGQSTRGAGSLADGIGKAISAGRQYEATMYNAASELTQAYAQNAGSIAQRAQSSGQEQGQNIRAALDSLTAMVNAITQTTTGMAQNLSR
jgi:hypothetical protein